MNFNSSNNQQFVKDAVDTYINKLEPLLDEIREKIKYSNVAVEYDENNYTYHLIEQKNTISTLVMF
jgi:hypothetical protein